MTDVEELIRLEEEGWKALSAPGGAAFYERILTEDATMLFPGIGLMRRDTILATMAQATPWSRFDLHEVSTRPFGADACLVTYRVAARREQEPEYEALISSVDVREAGRWKLSFHQHSPQPRDV